MLLVVVVQVFVYNNAAQNSTVIKPRNIREQSFNDDDETDHDHDEND